MKTVQRLIRIAACVAFGLLISACAATVKRNPSDVALAQMPATASAKVVLNVSGSSTSLAAKDWSDFKEEWRENFAEQAEAAHVKFQMQDGPPKATGEDGVLLSVYVEDYRFMRPGTRYMVGIMAGNAYIQSKLTYINLKSGESFGSQTINTSSSAWEGAFSPMTNKQVAAIASDVLRQIKSNSR